MDVDPSETELRVHNAMAGSPAIPGPVDNDEPIIYDYMKYPKKKNKFVDKSLHTKRRVHFRNIVEIVSYSSNGKSNIKESALRTEEEQKPNKAPQYLTEHVPKEE